MEPADPLRWLMRWYTDQCDGDWEHQYGIKIDTLDNPGWLLTVDLQGTSLEGQILHRTSHNLEAESDWWDCRTENNQFKGACGPTDLANLIAAFRRFAQGEPVK